MLSQEDEKFLALYSDSEYEKPSVTVDNVILRIKSIENENYRKLPEKKLQVYLTKRKNPPFINQYSIIGTFIDLKNELEDTMKLCVKNKVNLNNFYSEQLFTFGEKSRDPRTRVLSVSYLLLTNSEEELTGGEWFDIELKETNLIFDLKENGYELKKDIKLNLTNEEKDVALSNNLQVKIQKKDLREYKTITISKNNLAFDHLKIIYYALERLKNKLEYTDIIFNLIDREFTLTELKKCYELVLGENLLDANFRRKISSMVVPINKYAQSKGHRTSQLFRHCPNWNKKDLL